MLLQAVADKYTKSSDNHEWKQTKNNNNPKPNKAIDCSSCYVRLWAFKTDFIMKILLTTNEEIICKNIEFESKEVIVTLYETAKVFLKTLQDDNESMNFHECSECNIRCNCTTSECSCSCRTES